MSRYRRPKIEVGVFFFTLVVADRSGELLVRHIERLRQAYRAVQARLLFETKCEQRFATGGLGRRYGGDRGSIRGVIEPSGRLRAQNRPWRRAGFPRVRRAIL